MAVIFETLAYLPRWVQEEEDENHPFFGKTALGAVNFVKSSSGLTRSSVKVVDAYYGLHHSKNFAPLGLPSAFNAMSAAFSLKSAYRKLNQMKRIQDASGIIANYVSCTRAGLGAIGATLFIPIRALSFTAYMTDSKTVKAVEHIFGSVGKGIGETCGVISLVSSGLEIREELSLMQELNDRPAAEMLGDLQQRLQNPGERSAFVRVTSEACAQAVLAAPAQQAEVVIDRAFHEGATALSNSALTLALTALGIAATVIVSVSAAPEALLISAGISGFLSIYGFAMTLSALAKTFSGNPAQGRHDMALLVALTASSLLALTQTLFMQDNLLLQGITSTLGMAWVVVMVAAYLKR